MCPRGISSLIGIITQLSVEFDWVIHDYSLPEHLRERALLGKMILGELLTGNGRVRYKILPCSALGLAWLSFLHN